MQETIDYKTWVEIDQQALIQNLQVFQDYIGNQTLMAVIKGNAYGHGLVEAGKICAEAKVGFVGVDGLEEAMELRNNDIKLPILIINFTPKHRLEKLLEYDISQVVYDLDVLKAMVQVAKKHDEKFKVHIKFDTGMSRQGINLEEAEPYIKLLEGHQEQITFEGLLTHFADADNLKDQSYSDQQLIKFTEVLDFFKHGTVQLKYVHGFNTAATLAFTAKRQTPEEANMCRVGIGIYGLLPSPDFRAHFEKLKMVPVLSWKTRIIQVKTIKKGLSIGYGITEKAETDLKVAVLPVGYYEGVPRVYSSIGHVLIAGERCRIVGRVSMNLTVVDITNLKITPEVWGEVVLIGKQGNEEITADEFAEKTKTINYEVVSRINPLIKRIII